MHSTLLILALSLLQVSNAQIVSTVTVSVNTGACPATYTSSTTSAAVTGNPSPCPQLGIDYYTDSQGIVYDVACGVSVIGFDITSQITPSLDSCLVACDGYTGSGSACVAITYVAANSTCYLKSGVGYTTSGIGGDSAKLESYEVPPDVSSSIASQVATSTDSAQSTPTDIYSTSTSDVSPSPMSTSTGPTASPCPCPSSSDYYLDSNGYQYDIYCDKVFAEGEAQSGGDYAPQYVTDVESCLSICDNLNACTAAQYVPGYFPEGQPNCFFADDNTANQGLRDDPGMCVFYYPST